MQQMYDKYHNTDIVDLNEIFMTIDTKKREYNAFFALVPFQNNSSWKKIWHWSDIKKSILSFLWNSVITFCEEKVNSFWKDNIYEIFLTLQSNWVYINFAVHQDRSQDENTDEKDDITWKYFPLLLQFNNSTEIATYLRRRSGIYDEDLRDIIIFE